jgi:hypothetical protein
MLEGNMYDAEKAAPRMYRFPNGGKMMAFENSKDLFAGQKGNSDIDDCFTLKAQHYLS